MVSNDELYGGGMMFSKEWENRFSQGKSQSTFPWTDLIRYANKFGKPKWGNKVLELGPGIGANIPFFLGRGMDYYAIEGSESAVRSILSRYPELEDKVIVGDFTQSLFFDGKFNMIVDRSSVTHNDTKSIQNTLKLAAEKLEDDGRFIGIDWFSWDHNERRTGKVKVDDPYTYVFDSGKFEECGSVHFSTGEHIFKLFKDAGMMLEMLEHKTIHPSTIVRNKVSSTQEGEATWNLSARRKL